MFFRFFLFLQTSTPFKLWPLREEHTEKVEEDQFIEYEDEMLDYTEVKLKFISGVIENFRKSINTVFIRN